MTWFSTLVPKPAPKGKHGKRVVIGKRVFKSKTEAMRELGVGWTNLHRLMAKRKVRGPGRAAVPITIAGVEYSSLRQAQSATGKTYYAVRGLKRPNIPPLMKKGRPMRFRVLFNEVEYSSLTAAAAANDVCMETVRRHGTVLDMVPVESNLPQLRRHR